MSDTAVFVPVVPRPSDVATWSSPFARAVIRRVRDSWFAPDVFDADFPEKTSDPDNANFYLPNEKCLTPTEIAAANARGDAMLEGIIKSIGRQASVAEFFTALDSEVASWLEDASFPRDSFAMGTFD
jgi:hypothetical protein